MKIIKLQSAQINAATITAFLNSPACAGWPELNVIRGNPIYLNAIAVLFQVFANKSEVIGPFFNNLKSFLQNYDKTPSGKEGNPPPAVPSNSLAQTK